MHISDQTKAMRTKAFICRLNRLCCFTAVVCTYYSRMVKSLTCIVLWGLLWPFTMNHADICTIVYACSA